MEQIEVQLARYDNIHIKRLVVFRTGVANAVADLPATNVVEEALVHEMAPARRA